MPKILKLKTLPKHLDLALGLLYQEKIFTVEHSRNRDGLWLSCELPSRTSETKLLKKLRQKKIFSDLKVALPPKNDGSKEYLKYLAPFELHSQDGVDQRKIKIDPRGKIPKRREADTLYLSPSLAFGTGTHPTTHLCAELLMEIPQKKTSAFLDLGCGTGILAMIAKMLGAKTVWAVDNDPIALKVAKENFENNHLKGITLKTSLQKSNHKFDLIVANILLGTLLELKQEILKHLKSGGDLILSGLLYQDRREILEAYAEMKVVRIKNKKGWTALWLQKV